MVQAIHQTTEIPQMLLVFRSSMSLLCRVVQVLRCCCGEDLGAPTVAARWEICALLRSPVFGSHSFGVRLQSTEFWIFLGEDIRKRFRIQRLLVQHWIHVYVSLRRLLGKFHIFSMSMWTYSGSSCGAHRDVVYSPFEWLYHRYHCNCRDLVLFVGRLPWLCGLNVLRGCLRCDVVWW